MGLNVQGVLVALLGKKYEDELKAANIFETELYKAVNNIFGESYEYTRRYREFYEQKEEELKSR